MTTYLAIERQPQGLFKLWLIDGNRDMQYPFESWALLSGKQVIYCSSRLANEFRHQHVGGTFERGALYTGSFDDTVMVLGERLGPSDRVRYERARAEQDVHRTVHSLDRRHKWEAAGLGVVKLSLTLMWATLRAIGFVCLFPIFLHLFKRHK